LSDAELAPPIQRGDLILAARDGIEVALVIDGFFSQRPAVTHREIGYAAAQGVIVLGAASLGAIRAAEMGPPAMFGVGAIFRRYRSGEYLEDDAIAVIHGPAELEYRPLSEPLVNIEATLRDAYRSDVIDGGLFHRLRGAARTLHYAERSYEAAMARSGLGDAARQRLKQWLAAHRRDVKAEDARLALEILPAAARLGDRKPPAVEANFFLERQLLEAGNPLLPRLP
jgi:hypothetical protein